MGTNVSGHKRVWAQTCVGTNVSGHNRVGTIMWAQVCMGTNVWPPLGVYAHTGEASLEVEATTYVHCWPNTRGNFLAVVLKTNV